MITDHTVYPEIKTTTYSASIKRGQKFPLDCTELFLSLEDAEKYALGDPKNPDERRLYRIAYAGQMIGVKTGTLETDETKGEYDIYIIQGDGTLKKAGDTEYHPTNDELNTIQLGGIPAGTSAGKLKGQTFSELFDMLLFPTYAPVFTDATASISLSSTSLVEIGGTLPTATLKTTKAFTAAGSKTQNVVYGGEDNIDDYTVTTTDTSSTVGTKTWSQSVTFATGTDSVKDSKGQYITVNKTGSNYTTLLESASIDNRLEKSDDNYVIKSITKTAKATVEVVYPYYLPDASGVPTEQPLTSNNYFTDISYNATNAQSFMYIELPESASNVKILMKNLAGVYEEQPLNETVETVTKTINGTEYTYKKYSMYLSGGFNGSGVYKITFTKPK
jgi:hypothetical protein